MPFALDLSALAAIIAAGVALAGLVGGLGRWVYQNWWGKPKRALILYKKDDIEFARRLRDWLRPRLRRHGIRRPTRLDDPHEMRLGTDGRENTEDPATGADIVVAVIGEDWVDPGLADQGSVVRRELMAALLGGSTVIPVLVDGAPMPAREDLPEELQGLARCTPIRFDQQDWTQAFEHVAERILSAR
jgi:TIR domain-containing protein